MKDGLGPYEAAFGHEARLPPHREQLGGVERILDQEELR